MKRHRSVLDWRIVTAFIVVVAVLACGFVLLNRDTNPLPADIRSQLTFSPFVLPISSKSFDTSNYGFSKTETNEQILFFVIKKDDGTTIALSEYPQSAQFDEIADYKNRFLTNVAQQYDSVQTSNGTIYLGRLAKDNNRQLGIMLEKGLMVFMKPSTDLEKSEWRNLGDQLEIQKIVD